MKVDLIDHMGSDLTVVNAARVSFAKQSSYREDAHGWHLEQKDEKLIQYLAKHGHWTPFAHPQITVRVKAPLFVARQLGKHQVGLVWNEVSRRYVDDEPEFYVPERWRLKASDVKQGSSTKTYDGTPYHLSFTPNSVVGLAKRMYMTMLSEGICPEQARMVLPQSMYTEWYWTGSLYAFARVCKLRLDPHTQQETRELAKMLENRIAPLFPCSWKALMDRGELMAKEEA